MVMELDKTDENNKSPDTSNDLGCSPGQILVFSPGDSMGKCVDKNEYFGQ